MEYRVRHRTAYTYTDVVSLSHNEARLLPVDRPEQPCHGASLTIHPPPDTLHERVDFFGNRVTFFTIERPHEALEVIMECDVTVHAAPVDLPQSPAWDQFAQQRVRGEAQDIHELQFLLDSPLVQGSSELRAYAEPSFSPGRPVLEAVAHLNHRIYHDFDFVPDLTDVTTPLSEVLSQRAGVCQDFAQLGIGCLRSMGLAAKYVSGYIETRPPPGKTKLVGADASHAWFSVRVPGQGWIDFDPTNDRRASEQHITTGYGRDFTDVTPLKGVIYGATHDRLQVEVDVLPKTLK